MSILESVAQAIVNEGRKYRNMSPRQKERAAHVAGKLYGAFFQAAIRDIEKLGALLEAQNTKPIFRIGKLVYTAALPFSSTIMFNIDELITEFKDEFDNKHPELQPEPVMADNEAPTTEATPQQVNPKQAVTAADLAAGTVRRGVILSRSRYEQNL